MMAEFSDLMEFNDDLSSPSLHIYCNKNKFSEKQNKGFSNIYEIFCIFDISCLTACTEHCKFN